MSAATARVRPPRRIRPGTRPTVVPGTRLHCLVLTAGPEVWVAVDLASGAFVRAGAGEIGGGHHSLEVVALTVAGGEDPRDPSQPEAVVPAGEPEVLRRLRRRRIRRLLRRLAAPERPGEPILGTTGPSIAFMDLDGSAPSVVLLAATRKTLELRVRRDGQPVCGLARGGVDWAIPVKDQVAAAAALASPARRLRGKPLEAVLGFRPGFLLVGLGPVRGGHAPKQVLAVLPR